MGKPGPSAPGDRSRKALGVVLQIGQIGVLAGAVLAVATQTACLELSTGTDAGADGSSSATGTTSSGGVSTTTVTPTGSGCGTDPQTQVTLCEGISTCPNVDVDQSLFSGCGFRIAGATLDLECLCGTALCPIGVPTTCAQAVQVLTQQQNAFLVCEQASEGRCLDLGTTGSSSGGGAGTGTCDKTCESECAGVPSCLQLCGC